jgi:hypothetical protein
MEMAGKTARGGSTARWKGVALPLEHGGWGFLLEPILLGLLLAPNFAGLFLGLAVLGAFLLRTPLKLALKDRIRGKRYARKADAERFAALYAGLMGGSFALALLTSPHVFLAAIIPPLALALVQIPYDLKNRGREHVPEIAGALALNGAVMAILMAGGWTLTAALGVWATLALRTASSILYVRARLRLAREEVASPVAALTVHGLGLAVLAGVAATGRGPWLAAAGMAVLLVRAAAFLTGNRVAAPARVVGFQEMFFGALFAVLIALGYRLPL